jgi:hypothetical protein
MCSILQRGASTMTKQYIIKKGSDVIGYKDGEVVEEATVSRDVTFNENWFIGYKECEGCDCGTMIAKFYHKHFDLLTTDATNVSVREEQAQ